MSDEQNGHGLSRLDRMEGLMELLIDDHLKFRDEHKSLLTSQVLLTEQVGKLTETTAGLAETMKQVAASQKELSDAQKHTDERMDALISSVDDLIRNRPQ